MELLDLVATPLLAYLLVAFLVALDGVLPSVPSDAAVIAAGAFGATGHLNLLWVGVAVVAGSVVGDQTSYRVGRHGLPGLLRRHRTGVRINRGIVSAYTRLGSQQSTALVTGRFVPFGRIASAIAAGLGAVTPRRFLIASAIGAILWATWLIGLGYVTSSVTDGPLWLQVVAGVVVGVAIASITAAAQRVIQARRRARGQGAGPEKAGEADNAAYPSCSSAS